MDLDQEERIEHENALGCFTWRELSMLRSGEIVAHFRQACLSRKFAAHCAQSGFANPSFRPNGMLKPGNPGYEKFLTGIHALTKKEGSNNADESSANSPPACLGEQSGFANPADESSANSPPACLGVVFHGTATANIDPILKDGLDPKLRRGQAYGPGEYFSKDPGTSVGYCRGGLEMLVFVVVLPLVPCKQPQYVVVSDNNHQLPIGTLKFQSVDRNILAKSKQLRADLTRLSWDVMAKSQVAEEARMKAKIIQELITGFAHVAGEFYQRKKDLLGVTSRKEISWYAHQKLDIDVVSIYFPDLPDPIRASELDDANIESLDDAERKEIQAKKKLKERKRAHLRCMIYQELKHYSNTENNNFHE